MRGQFCDSKTSRTKLRKRRWYQGRLYIVENVDAEACTECGERYFHAATPQAIDKLIAGDHKLIAGDHAVKEVLSVKAVSAQPRALRSLLEVDLGCL